MTDDIENALPEPLTPPDCDLRAEAGTGIQRHTMRPDIYPAPAEAE